MKMVASQVDIIIWNLSLFFFKIIFIFIIMLLITFTLRSGGATASF